MSALLAAECVADLVTRIGALDFITPAKVFHVYSEEELLNYQKGVIFPCVGVVYDGMRRTPLPADREGSPGGGKIASSEMSFTILSMFRSQPQAKLLDPKDMIVGQVDRMRSALMGQRSPTGHFWLFTVEASIPGKSGVLCYLQRWTTAVQLR